MVVADPDLLRNDVLRYCKWGVDVLTVRMLEWLRAGGEVFFQSDVWDLALDAMDVFERAENAFANARGPWSFLPSNPFGVQSKRELYCEEDRRPIWRMLYQKKGLEPR